MVLWIILALSLVVSMADGLCMPEHVQTLFCNADYAIRVRVTSAVKFEVPDLPTRRPTSPIKPKTPITDNKDNKIKKKPTVSVVPKRRVESAPAPLRLTRSIVSSARSHRQHPLMGWRYQEIKIKRILKGVGFVENTERTQARLRSDSKKVRYKSRMYVSPFLHLKPGKVYLLAGKIIANRLFLSRCNWYAAWDKLSFDQIRGLKKTFVLGCKCQVQFCFEPGCENKKNKGACMWKPQGFYPVDDCRYHYSSCRVHKGNCQWIDSGEYHNCMKNKKKNKKTSLP